MDLSNIALSAGFNSTGNKLIIKTGSSKFHLNDCNGVNKVLS